MPLEIERKFLVRKLPDGLTSYPASDIAQGYLIARPMPAEQMAEWLREHVNTMMPIF